MRRRRPNRLRTGGQRILTGGYILAGRNDLTMRYKILVPDTRTYMRVMDFLNANDPTAVQVALPERRMIGVELSAEEEVCALRDLGARVTEDYQFAKDLSDRIG